VAEIMKNQSSFVSFVPSLVFFVIPLTVQQGVHKEHEEKTHEEHKVIEALLAS
jgi:hypothetical protein